MTYLVGQRLGRYEIEEEVGRGGMARVYRAFDTSLRRTVALKVLAPQLAVDPEFSHRFEREAITAANLRHPNIVGIYDVGEQDGTRYIAMEYVRGRSLYAIIEERGALGLSYAVSIVDAVGSALDYAHAQGAVHRDVKPQNIMIDVDGRVLLTDFGIAQPPESDGRRERLTRTGVFMGTPEYISPEQASAERVDGRSDLYSLGVVTYEIITGHVPFSGSTLQIIVAHIQNDPPPPTQFAPAQPPEIDKVLARILAKQPQRRYDSGAAFTSALRIIARKSRLPIATPAQLADLAQPLPIADLPEALPDVRPVGPPPAPPASSEPTRVGVPPLVGAGAGGSGRQAGAVRMYESPVAEPRRPAARPLTGDAGRRAGFRLPWMIMVPVLAVVAILAGWFLFGSGASSNNPNPFTPSETPTLGIEDTKTPTPSNTPTNTSTPTDTPTVTPTAMSTPEPTSAPTNVSVPPTTIPFVPSNTPVPPTDTPVPPTDTLAPTDTPLPTDTPTATPTATPTLTPTPEVTPYPAPATQEATLPSQSPTSPPEATTVATFGPVTEPTVAVTPVDATATEVAVTSTSESVPTSASEPTPDRLPTAVSTPDITPTLATAVTEPG